MDADTERDFDQEAASWDESPVRVRLASELAEVILRELGPTAEQDALDYGCGTGLVTLRLQPFVRAITGADSSRGMLDVLEKKAQAAAIQNLTLQQVDLAQGGALDGRYHLLVSTMTLHHVREPAALFRTFHDLLLPGGGLGIADLDAEDGSFHGDGTGVHHLGFDREQLASLLRDAGFDRVRSVTATAVTKPIADGSTKTFPVFLLVGHRA